MASALDELYGDGHGEGSGRGIGPGGAGGGRAVVPDRSRVGRRDRSPLRDPRARGGARPGCGSSRADALLPSIPRPSSRRWSCCSTCCRWRAGSPSRARPPPPPRPPDRRRPHPRARPTASAGAQRADDPAPVASAGRATRPAAYRAGEPPTARVGTDGATTLVPERRVFRSRARRSVDWHVILVVDVSGSMEPSVIYSAARPRRSSPACPPCRSTSSRSPPRSST